MNHTTIKIILLAFNILAAIVMYFAYKFYKENKPKPAVKNHNKSIKACFNNIYQKSLEKMK